MQRGSSGADCAAAEAKFVSYQCLGWFFPVGKVELKVVKWLKSRMGVVVDVACRRKDADRY